MRANLPHTHFDRESELRGAPVDLIVAEDMDLAVAAESTPQLIEVGQKQRRVPALPRCPLGEEHLAGPPGDRAGEIPLLVIARGLDERGDGSVGLLPRNYTSPITFPSVGIDPEQLNQGGCAWTIQLNR